MAEAQDTLDVSDVKDNFLECSVCLEHFDQEERRPRLLVNCLHAFCSQCLEQLLEREGGGQVTCPNCRQVQQVKGTAKSLPVDPVRNKLVDYVQFKKGKKIPCTDCPDGSHAAARCHECKIYMCTQCNEAHRRNRMSRKHTCVSLEGTLSEPLKSFFSHFCEDHPDHKIEFFCRQCSSLCCVSCSIWKHKGHDLVPVEDAANSMLSSMKTKMDHVEKSAFVLRRKKASLEKESAQQRLNLQQNSMSINHTFEKLIGQLKMRQKKLMNEIQEKTESTVNSLKKQQEATEDSLAQMESALEYFKQIESKSDDCEVLSAGPVLVQSLEAAAAVDETQDVQHPTWTFLPEEMTNIISKVHSFGKIANTIPGTDTKLTGSTDFQAGNVPGMEQVLHPSHVQQGRTLTTIGPTEATGGTGERSEPRTIVKVSGYYQSTAIDALCNYFENKRFGGGEIQEIWRCDSKMIVYIEFEEEEVARRVATRSHTVSGYHLTVELVESMYSNKALISGVPNLASTDPLVNYLQAGLKIKVSQILFGEEPGMIVVSFVVDSDGLDLAEFKRRLARKEFAHGGRRFTLRATPVPQTKSVTVHNIPYGTSEETLELYFESRRRGGGEVEKVMLNPHQQYAVVTFADVKVAEAVCQREHRINRVPVQVHLCFDQLGEMGGSFEPPVASTHKQP